MTCYEFNVLPEEQQLTLVAETGRFLSLVWEHELAINLYYLPGSLLIVLAYDTQGYRIRRFQAINNSEELAGYLSLCPLPEGLLP